MKIRTKIIGLVIVLLFLGMVLGAYSVFKLKQIRKEVSWVLNQQMDLNRQLLAISQNHLTAQIY